MCFKRRHTGNLKSCISYLRGNVVCIDRYFKTSCCVALISLSRDVSGILCWLFRKFTRGSSTSFHTHPACSLSAVDWPFYFTRRSKPSVLPFISFPWPLSASQLQLSAPPPLPFAPSATPPPLAPHSGRDNPPSAWTDIHWHALPFICTQVKKSNVVEWFYQKIIHLMMLYLSTILTVLLGISPEHFKIVCRYVFRWVIYAMAQ